MEENRQKIIELIADAFDDNKSVNIIIPQDKSRKKRIKALVQYSHDYAVKRNGVIISKDKKGAAFFYNPIEYPERFSDYWLQFKLVLNATGFGMIPKLLKREGYKKRHYPKTPFIYFWYVGVDKNHRGGKAFFELKNEVINLAKSKNLPIYLETSVPENVKLYERFGFEVYHIWEEENIKLYFMRKNQY